MLEKISLFRTRYFAEGSAPAVVTLKKHIDQGLLAGRLIGGRYFVETNAWGEPLFYKSAVTKTDESPIPSCNVETGNPLANKVLARFMQKKAA